MEPKAGAGYFDGGFPERGNGRTAIPLSRSGGFFGAAGRPSGGGTASGFGTLYFNTTGDNNTADGIDALFYNTTGSNNTANGFAALLNSTNDSGLVAIGYQALQNDNAFPNHCHPVIMC